MSMATKAETAKVMAERNWWRSVLPSGWALVGWTDREYANAVDALGGRQELNGHYITRLVADGRLSATP